VLGGLQCHPQYGTYFVRLGIWFSGIGSRPTPLSVTVLACCRAGNAWWDCCALQGLFLQCASHRYEYFFGLLCCQHCAIAGLYTALLTSTAITRTTQTGWFRILGG